MPFYLFLFSKSKTYWYDADAIRTEYSPETKQQSFDTMDFKARDKYANKGSRAMKMPSGWDTSTGSHGNIHRLGREKKCKGSSGSHCATLKKGSMVDQLGKGANARTVWTIPPANYSEAHFATFPPELPRRCILAGCPPGGVVLDPFAGSGTTLAVAFELGRDAIGIELNPLYARMIQDRLGLYAPDLEVG